MYAITLVGGKGERLRPLTNDRPKCMVELLGKPILEHQLVWLQENGITDVVLACGHLHEVIEAYFGVGAKWGLRLQYAVEDQPLGRGGAFKLGYTKVPDDEAIVIGTNGDNVNTQPLAPMIDQHTKSGAIGTLLLTQLRSPFGIVQQEGDRIVAFEEAPLLPQWLSAGVYVLDRSFFAALPDVGDHEDELFPKLASERKLFGFQSDAYWKAIDTMKDLSVASEQLAALREGKS